VQGGKRRLQNSGDNDMKLRWLDYRTKQWECCGNIWQLMMSRLYPERYHWFSVCPFCGKQG